MVQVRILAAEQLRTAEPARDIPFTVLRLRFEQDPPCSVAGLNGWGQRHVYGTAPTEGVHHVHEP